MKNILYIIYTAGNGGSEEYVYKLINNMDRKKFKPFLAYSKKGELVERLLNLDIKCFNVEMKNIFDLNSIKQLNKIIKENDIKIIHAQFARENYLSVFTKILNKNIKVIYTNHIILEESAIKMFLNRFITKKDDKIIAVSNTSKMKMISQNVDKTKIEVIYNGTKNFDITDKDEVSKRIRKEYGLVKTDFVAINISRFSEEKGLLELIESINLLKLDGIKIKLFLVGDGLLMEDIKQKIKLLNLENEIILTGFKKNTRDYILASDLYINSSKNENLSFSIIDSLAAGLPVVATRVGGNIEIVTNSIGLVCDFDVKDIKEKIKIMIKDKDFYEKCKKNCRNYAKNKFNEKIMLEKTYLIYEN